MTDTPAGPIMMPRQASETLNRGMMEFLREKRKGMHMEEERMSWYGLTIERATRGFIVRVGCQTVVFNESAEDRQEMGAWLAQYYANPSETQVKFFKKYPVEGVPVDEVTQTPPSQTRII